MTVGSPLLGSGAAAVRRGPGADGGPHSATARRDDARASLAPHRLRKPGARGDQDLSAGLLDELDGSADLRTHASLRKLSPGLPDAGLPDVHRADRLLVGLSEVDRHLVDAGQ